MSLKLILSHRAYLSMLLHAAKYPHKNVNGVILGEASSIGEIQGVRTIPLLHHWTSLSPMMEIGLDLANTHASENNLQIVGYYQANSNPHDEGLGVVGTQIKTKLQQSNPKTIALLIQIDGLTPKATSGVPAVSPYPSGNISLQNPQSPARTIQLIADGLQNEFADFDDHLEKVHLDWLNNPDCTDAEWS